MKLEKLNDVLLDSLMDLYNAEKQLTKALPKMAKAATAPELQDAFEEHLQVTQEHVHRLDEVFQQLGMKAKGKHCPAMEGMIEEGQEVIERKDDGNSSAIDAALIAAAQKVEHYEMSAYGSARTFAHTLGFDHAADLLQQTLDEESQANEKLTSIAEQHVNVSALHGQEDEAGDNDAGEPASRHFRGEGRRGGGKSNSRSNERNGSRSNRSRAKSSAARR